MRIVWTIVLGLITGLNASGQITITSSDMPDESDTFRYSNASSFLPVDYSATGAGHTWDFTNLNETGQYVDTFLSVLNTPLQYQPVFNQPFDPDQATLAQHDDNLTFGPVQAEDVYYYYTEKSDRFQIKGFGASINGAPTPVEYNSPDVLYKFPLTYQDQYTSSSSFELNVPNYAFIGRTIDRSCEVTGWGMLITPLDSFQAIKLRCEVAISDTIFVQDAGQGVTLDQPKEVHYKWLAKNEGVPVLQINTTEVISGTEIVNDIFYRDTLTTPDPPDDTTDTTTTVHQQSNEPFNLKIFPNPVPNHQLSVRYRLAHHTDVTITIVDVKGRIIYRKRVNNQESGWQQYHVQLDKEQVNPGMYFLQIQGEQFSGYKRFLLQE